MENRKCSELISTGSQALRYFEILEVRYLRWVGEAKPPVFRPYVDLHKLFYQHNGLNEDAFRRAADALKLVLDRVATERNRQATFAHTIPTVWWGGAAAAASNMMATQLQLSEADINIVRRVHEAMDAAPQALREALAIEANAAGLISTSHDIKVDDKTPEDIDSIITFARGFGVSGAIWGTDTLVDKVDRIFPELAVSGPSMYIPGISDGDSTYVGKMKTRCIGWLNDTFKREYEENLGEFVTACDRTNQDLANTYNELANSFANLNATKYPCPKVSQTPPTTDPAGATTAQPAGTGTPTTTGTPSTTTAPTTTTAPSNTNTPSTTTTSTDNPLSAIASLGTQLASSGIGTQLTEGLNSLVSSATQQITSTLEQLREQAENVIDPDDDKDLGGEGKPDEDADGDGKPDEDADGDGEPDKDLDGDGNPDSDVDGDGKPDAAGQGVEFNGQNYKLEVGSDGRLKLVVDSAAGEPVIYEIEIGPDGKPTIISENPPGETAPPETENQQPADQPAGAPGVPGGKQQEDGEHQPQNYPPPQQSEEDPTEPEPPALPSTPPVDTGAQLAEAGPL